MHRLQQSFQVCQNWETTCEYHPQAKSLYRSRAGRHFYGTENMIWAGFGLVGSTEKNNWADYGALLRAFFSCFVGKKNKKN